MVLVGGHLLCQRSSLLHIEIGLPIGDDVVCLQEVDSVSGGGGMSIRRIREIDLA